MYRGYLPVYKILIPRHGSMASLANREKIVATWLRSKGFRRTGLGAELFSPRIVNECRTGGDFIRLVMDSVTERQDAHRWAFHDGDNVLHFRRIKKDIPNALFVHIIRDGRDIALSLKKMAGFAPLPWDRSETIVWSPPPSTGSGWCAADAKPQKSSPPITSRSATKIWLRIPTKLWQTGQFHRPRSRLRSDPEFHRGYTFQDQFILPRRGEGKDQSAGPLEGTPFPGEHRRSRRRCGRLSRGKRLPALASRARAPHQLAQFLDAPNVPRISRHQALAQIEYSCGRLANVSALELTEDPCKMPSGC